MKPKKEVKKPKTQKKKERKPWKWQAVFAACSIFMFLFTLLLTVVLHPDYVRMSADLNPFVTTDEFFHESMRHAGGLLAYSARFIQSLFYFPALGITILSLILIALAFVLMKLFKVSAQMVPLCFVPPLMLLLNYTQMGYMIFVLKAPAPAVTLPLGVLCAASLAWAYSWLSNKWIRLSLLAVILLAGYPLLGTFAFFALALCLLADILNRNQTQKEGKSRIFIFAIWTAVIILSAVVPHIYLKHTFTLMSASAVYSMPLPDFYWEGAERMLWLPSFVAIAGILLLAWKGGKEGFKTGYMTSAILLIVALYTYYLNNHDSNFNNILKMSRATDEAEWQKVVDIAGESKVPPTRVEVLFRNLALQKLGSASDSMFKFEDGDAPYNTPREYQYLRLLGARSLYYYYGKVNYAYRWCMEDMVEYGMRPAYIEYMLRCAIVNEEPKLVEKYRNLLSNMPFRSADVKDYQPKDEVSAMPLKSLMNYNDLLDGDAGLIEVYLLNNFALTDGGSQEMVNLSLQCNMILKDINGFWPRFIKLYPTFSKGIPLHYQEAALLFSRLENSYDISQLPIDEGVKARFEQMVQESTANSALGDEENAKRLKPTFGDTYWYYYFFVKGLKTN